MRLFIGMEMTQIQLHQSSIHVASHEGWKSEAHCLICEPFTRLESVCSDSWSLPFLAAWLVWVSAVLSAFLYVL